MEARIKRKESVAVPVRDSAKPPEKDIKDKNRVRVIRAR
jgi:hypothetical protein